MTIKDIRPPRMSSAWSPIVDRPAGAVAGATRLAPSPQVRPRSSTSRSRRTRSRLPGSPPCWWWRRTSRRANARKRRSGRARRATAPSSSTRRTASSSPIATATTSTPTRACAGCWATPATSSSACMPRTSSSRRIRHIGSALHAIAGPSDYHREWQFRRKDGSIFAADVMATSMPDGNLLAMIRDVTERNRSIEALRATEERMRFALENAEVGIWDMDYAHRSARVVRRSSKRSTACRPAGSAGPSRRSIELVHPDDRAAVLETIEQGDEARRRFLRCCIGRSGRRHGPVAERRGPHPPRRPRAGRCAASASRWTSPSAARWRRSFNRPRRWKRSDGWPAAWPTTSTIC